MGLHKNGRAASAGLTLRSAPKEIVRQAASKDEDEGKGEEERGGKKKEYTVHHVTIPERRIEEGPNSLDDRLQWSSSPTSFAGRQVTSIYRFSLLAIRHIYLCCSSATCYHSPGSPQPVTVPA